MSTLSSTQDRRRPATPELPPTLTPNPIASVAQGPSRVLSSLMTLLVYGLFAAGSFGIARTVHQTVVQLRTTPEHMPVILNPDPEDVRPPLPPPPPPRFVSGTTVATRPPDWTPVTSTNVVPEETPTTVPQTDRALHGFYNASMPVAEPGTQASLPDTSRLAGPQGGHSAQVVDVSYSQVRVLQKGSVVYPTLARLARIQGPVEVLITIDPSGVPVAVSVESGPSQLHAEALRSAREWRFEPARVDGRPTSARFRLTIHFRLM